MDKQVFNPLGYQDPHAAWRWLRSTCQGDRDHDAELPDATPADLADYEPAEAAGMLCDRYAPLVAWRGPRPLVVAQLGQSLDGRIATANGHSHFVTGPADRVHLHRLRALSDGVLVGAGTVVADDPQLTVRSVPGRHPVRIVVCPRDGLDPTHRVFTDGEAPTWVITGEAGQPPPADRVFRPPVGDPPAILDTLAEAGLQRLLIEGGARTVSAWLAAGLIDVLYLTVAPIIIGAGPMGLQLPAIDHMDQALRPQVQTFPLGRDRLYRLGFSAEAEP